MNVKNRRVIKQGGDMHFVLDWFLALENNGPGTWHELPVIAPKLQLSSRKRAINNLYKKGIIGKMNATENSLSIDGKIKQTKEYRRFFLTSQGLKYLEEIGWITPKH